MMIVSVPWPVIFAPIAFRQFPRSIISGSLAALMIWVLPLARLAAIIVFSVAPTDTTGNTILFPTRPFLHRALIYPSASSTIAPNCCIAQMCKSTGRVPIAHPPGKETLTLPYLANKGPSTNMEARILRTCSYGASRVFASPDILI